MLVLALDTATSRMTAGLVELTDAGEVVPRATRSGEGSRAHAERLAPWIREVTDEAGTAAVDAVVCGLGPGPFTGLRVGLVTAAAIGDARGLPVHGVPTHDAVALAADPGATGPEPAGPASAGPGRVGPVLVVTDARRREVYWSVVDPAGPRATAGPDVARPADLAVRLAPGGDLADRLAPDTPVVGDAAATLAEHAPSLRVLGDPAGPTPAALVAAAAAALRSGRVPEPLVPLYLRRPDAVPPGAPKPVTRPG